MNTIDFSKIDTSIYFFDKVAADRAVRFIESFCSHVKGELAKEPYLLQDWEKEIISNIFGWKKISTGLRKFREVFIFLPRKNPKSTLSSPTDSQLLTMNNCKWLFHLHTK